jgi:hypothetical protein
MMLTTSVVSQSEIGNREIGNAGTQKKGRDPMTAALTWSMKRLQS